MNINNPPSRSGTLYENLFEGRARFGIIEIISAGINAICANQNRLMADVNLLAKSKRFSSAHFLLTTAKEEMAKVSILLDICRLNFSKYESTLRCLCKAFYDHISKHAYFQMCSFWPIHDMQHAKEIWESETTKWFPQSDPSSGVPDMPHETYFDRELPLYVDYIEYDQKWWIPDNREESILFENILGKNILVEAEKYSECIHSMLIGGLFDPDCLTILNDEFKKTYISDKTENLVIKNLNKKVASRFMKEKNIGFDIYFNSIYANYPLYHFLTQ